MFDSNCTSTFGQKPSFGAFGSSSSLTSSSGSSIQQSHPAFGSSLFDSSSQPSYGTAGTPAFGPSITPAFGVASTSPIRSTGISHFTSSGGAFGGVSSAPVFGSSSTAFGAASTPAFGFSRTGIFGASSASAPSFNFGSTPAPLASQASTTAFGSPGFGQSSFGAQHGGSRVTAYAPTAEVDAGTATPGKLESISAMPAYKDKSYEELRWEDYQSGDKGGPAQGNQSAGGATFLFGRSFANPFSSSSTSNPFAPKLGFSDSGFGFSVSSPAHLAPSSPLGSTSSTSSLFSSQTPAFHTTAPSMFSTTGSFTFGTPNSFFGAASTPAFGAASTPAFGAASTPAFGAASTLAFGSSRTGIFGASSASAPSFNFGSTPAPFASQASTTAFGSPEFGQSSLGAQRGGRLGSRVTLYAPTVEVDAGTATPGKLESISAMPAYEVKSYEELRWEDYQSGDKGGPAQGNQFADGATFLFGQSSANAFSSSPTSNPFAPKLGFSDSGFGFSVSSPVYTPPALLAPSSPFGSTPSTSSLFSSQTPEFPTTTPSMFSTAAGSSLNFDNHLSLPLFQLSTPSMLPSFSRQYTSTFGFNSSPASGSASTLAFGTASTPAFGSSCNGIFDATSARAPSFNFGSTPAPFGHSIAFGQLTRTHAFWQSIPAFGTIPFGTTVSPFGGQANQFASQASSSAFGSLGFGQSSFGAQRRGSRVTPYAPTEEVDAGIATPGKLESLSAMPAYKDKSYEELRWEDYQFGDKGGPAQGIQSAGGLASLTSLFGQSSANPFSNRESSMDSKCGEGKFERISGTVIAFNIGDLVLIACDGMWFKHGNQPKVDGYHFVKVCWVLDEVFIAVAGCLKTAFSIITSIVREFETDPPRNMKKIANMIKKRADRCGDCGFIIGGKLNEGTNLELWKVCRPADNLPYRSDRLSTGNMFIIGGGSTDALARVTQTLGGDFSQINHWNPLQIMDLLHEALLSASSKKENATGGDFNCVAVNARGVSTFATSTPGNPSAENVGDRGYSGWKYDAAAVKPRWYEFKPN